MYDLCHDSFRATSSNHYYSGACERTESPSRATVSASFSFFGKLITLLTGLGSKFLSKLQELQEIFENCPPIKPVGTGSVETDDPGNRKPIEGDCPICFMEFDAQNEQIVWCKAACGNNIHKTCFSQWAATSGKSKVQCVYWYVTLFFVTSIKK